MLEPLFTIISPRQKRRYSRSHGKIQLYEQDKPKQILSLV